MYWTQHKFHKNVQFVQLFLRRNWQIILHDKRAIAILGYK